MHTFRNPRYGYFGQVLCQYVLCINFFHLLCYAFQQFRVNYHGPKFFYDLFKFLSTSSNIINA